VEMETENPRHPPPSRYAPKSSPRLSEAFAEPEVAEVSHINGQARDVGKTATEKRTTVGMW
jgi:hypothetical protein